MQQASEATAQQLRENWSRAVDDVAQACAAAGREPSEVSIVGVSKYVGAELAWQLAAAGCCILAENRPQSLWDKANYFGQHDSVSAQWHLIGHLQRNKLKRTLPLISLLHSLDSFRLADAINTEQLAAGAGPLSVLLEVNVTHDAAKTGMALNEVHKLLQQAPHWPGIAICGLMAMSSLDADAPRAQREFEQVRLLRDDLQREYGQQFQFSELSMGMSGDFKEAIAAGSTLVRIGSNLWRGII